MDGDAGPGMTDAAAARKRFVLAHLSDPHLGPLPRPRVHELASKRLLGYINWQRGRRRVHLRDALDALTGDLKAARPDHVAVTGDLVNIALPDEFLHARRWLDSVGRPTDVSVVPGNHDAYVAGAGAHRDRHWLPYMTGDAGAVPPSAGAPQAGEDHLMPAPRPREAEGADGDGFPYLRRRGPVALVGVSSAVATGPLLATGRLGDAQIARLVRVLEAARAAGLFRVVMIHHPPVAAAHHKCLTDAAAFQRALADAGAELVIHGHDHVHSLVAIVGRDGRIPVVGVPSASVSAGTKRRGGAYNLYHIDGGPGAWSCEVVSRGLRPSGAVAEVSRFALSWQ